MKRMGMGWGLVPWWAVMSIFVGLLVAACGGGGGSPGANPTTGGLSVGGVSAVTVLPGESKRLPISGGVPPYQAVSAESAVAAAAVDGPALVVGGVAPGASTTITVSDRAGTTQTVTVTVGTSVPLLTTAPSALVLGVGASEARTFRVSGGVRPYTIVGSAPLVATVTQLDEEQWRIQGVAMGDMQVRIRDAAGTELSVAVTVGSPELRISSDALTLPIGMPATVVLSGGQKPYSVAGGIPAAIQVRQVSGSDSTYEIVGLLATNDVDVVFMDASGKMVKVKVTANTATTQVRVSPSAVSLGEQSGSAVQFSVLTAARGVPAVFSSFPGLVSVSAVTAPQFNADGSILTPATFVGTVSGSACVTADTPVTLTVIDSHGSIGTAVVTVVNTNPNCPGP